MMIHHYNCLLFIIIPLVTEVRMMLKKGKIMRKEGLFNKRSQGKTGRYIDQGFPTFL